LTDDSGGSLTYAFTQPRTTGQSIQLTALSLGNGPATYQWQLNQKNIPGATNVFLDFPVLRRTNAGIYRVLVSNALRSAAGRPIVLAVDSAPLWIDPLPVTPDWFTQGFRGRVMGTSGLGRIIISASTNLVDWTPFITNQASSSPVEFADPTASDIPARFFRAMEEELP
jgi:hypothetical protein